MAQAKAITQGVLLATTLLLLARCPSASPTCDACRFSWRVADDVLSDPQVVNGVVAFAKRHVCPALGDKCQNVAEGLLPVVLQWLAQPATGEQFCAWECPMSQLVRPVQQPVEDDAQCALCQLVVGQVQQILNSTVVFDKINATAQQACSQLPPDMAATCSAFINKYEPLLEALISQAHPQELCELLGVCSKKLIARLARATMPNPPASVTSLPSSTIQQRVMGRMGAGGKGSCGGSAFAGSVHEVARKVQVARLAAAPGVPQGALGDSCDMCKMAVIEVHSLITNPSVQQSIVNYTEALCDQFESFNATCKLYVETYAPVVFSLLQQYLVPDSLCVEIGVCPAPPAAFTSVASADGLLGQQLASTVAAWVAQMRAALGVRASADKAVAMELASAAANAWRAGISRDAEAARRQR